MKAGGGTQRFLGMLGTIRFGGSSPRARPGRRDPKTVSNDHEYGSVHISVPGKDVRHQKTLHLYQRCSCSLNECVLALQVFVAGASGRLGSRIVRFVHYYFITL